MSNISKIFVVGATGAQGIPVVQGLVKDKAYFVRALTRNPESSRAKSLLALGNVELVEGTFASEEDLREGFRGCDGAFVNIDGFNCGEKTEMFWAIRAYELAIEEGIKFFVYGNLDFVYKKSGYNPIFRTGHYDGKGRIAEWILQQTKQNGSKMGAAIFTSGPYMEMTISKGTPMSPMVEDGVVTWRVPLGDGAVAHVALDDCAYYVRWLFDNPGRANGMDLEVAIDHIPYSELARAFEKVTGRPAKYVDTDMDTYWLSGPMSFMAEMPAGYNSDVRDPAAMSTRRNFTGFWTMWTHSGGNRGVIQRNYALLDEIHPNRIKSAEQWLRREDAKAKADGLGGLFERVESGGPGPLLKMVEDGLQGRL
ncbi:NmrA-like protein [Macrophomina phaseolina MS6]|uniref:NmrA-like protein n=1 Tax=Macrophomina phaseolina (strain MS6) TaxID=1126212 RepID=K2RW11_MACPH|nr:NmrA-like protein [Macrophomina phaseolina MS6]